MPWSVERILQLNVSRCVFPVYLGSLLVRGLGRKGQEGKGGASQFLGNVSIASLSKAGDAAV